MRVGEVRVKDGAQAGGRQGGMAVGKVGANSAKRSQQLQLLNAVPPYRPAALPILDERQRGTKFVSLEPKSVLNSPQQTGVDFWSLNPYIGCEFGRSEEHTSELQSRLHLVCRLLLEKKNRKPNARRHR